MSVIFYMQLETCGSNSLLMQTAPCMLEDVITEMRTIIMEKSFQQICIIKVDGGSIISGHILII